MVSIPQGAQAIGSKLYLFKATSNAAECLISAHGGYRKGNLTFSVPYGVTISFYGPHGFILQDPGVKIMSQELAQFAVETKKQGEQCINYILSKYQGTHNTAGETYESISDTIEDFQNRFLQTQDKMRSMGNVNDLSKGQLSRYNMMSANLRSLNAMNVATIRNRWYSPDLTLEYVVKEVKKAVPSITHFHCSFCRGHMDDDNAPTWQVGKGRV